MHKEEFINEKSFVYVSLNSGYLLALIYCRQTHLYKYHTVSL